MKTVFSHIIQRRLSNEKENIATDALAFIIQSSEEARNGLMKVLKGMEPDLSDLWFKTQQSEGNVRPDIWGMEDGELRVLIENKFWAGLTENQPVEYLRILEKREKTGILLIVVPESRQETIWREMKDRLVKAGISFNEKNSSQGIYRTIETGIGPILAITSWKKVLSAIQLELTDKPKTMNDLQQLRALCDAANSDAFVPISSSELTNQRFPDFILQLNTIVDRSVQLAITEGFLSTEGLQTTFYWDRIGQYVSFPKGDGVGARFGIHFELWREYGGTPLWIEFSDTDWGRAHEVRPILEPWAHERDIFTSMEDDRFVMGLDLLTNEEKNTVVQDVVKKMKDISDQLAKLKKNE